MKLNGKLQRPPYPVEMEYDHRDTRYKHVCLPSVINKHLIHVCGS